MIALDTYGMFARGGAELMFYMEITGNPWSKSRPRFARRGKYVTTYQPQDDRQAEAALRDALSEHHREPFPGNVMLACRFYRGDFQRIDTDNLLKHVCDSANGILWADDSQVTLVLGEAHHDPDRPRTIIVAGNHASTLVRGDDRMQPCAHCGERFLPPAGRAPRRFCSHQCSHRARKTVLDVLPCPQCGDPFRPVTKTQKLCSRVCVAAALTGRQKERAKAKSLCATCGKALAHTRGGRCRGCWRAAPELYPRQTELIEEQ